MSEKIQGILFINPGSTGQPRYGYPPSVALLEITGDSIKARLVDLTGYDDLVYTALQK